MDPETIDNVLSADDILSSKDTELIHIEIPEWQKNGKPGVVYLRPLNLEQQVDLADTLDGPAKKNGMVLGFVASVVDATGKPLFTEKDVTKLRQKSFRVFNRIQQAILTLNGLRQDETTAAKNV